jgi:NAD(P)-dependent dehydrogenase (short-subunit alcohol dehydrogenase family)
MNALITGGSRGLGRELALELARRHWTIVLVARHGVDEVVDEIRLLGGAAAGITADIAGDAARIVGQATALVGALDLVVHNASTLGPTPLRPLLETDAADLARVLDVNLLAPFRLTRLLVGQMSLRGQGTVVFISSDAATEAYPTWGAYGVSKAAGAHLMRIWAEEVPSVRFLSIDPGEMDTAMHAAAIPDADRTTLQRPADVARRIAQEVSA